jgi:hypothetical protein
VPLLEGRAVLAKYGFIFIRSLHNKLPVFVRVYSEGSAASRQFLDDLEPDAARPSITVANKLVRE